MFYFYAHTCSDQLIADGWVILSVRHDSRLVSVYLISFRGPSRGLSRSPKLPARANGQHSCRMYHSVSSVEGQQITVSCTRVVGPHRLSSLVRQAAGKRQHVNCLLALLECVILMWVMLYASRNVIRDETKNLTASFLMRKRLLNPLALLCNCA